MKQNIKLYNKLNDGFIKFKTILGPAFFYKIKIIIIKYINKNWHFNLEGLLNTTHNRLSNCNY